MKFNRIFWGIGLIISAIVLVATVLGVDVLIGDVAVGTTLLGFWFLYVFIFSVCKKWLLLAISTLTVAFLVFERYIDPVLHIGTGADVINNWIVIIVAVMLYFGIKLLFGSWSKKRLFDDSVKIGRVSTRYIDCASFESIFIENNAAKLDVYFSNTEHYKGEGTLNIANNASKMNVHIPTDWKAVCNVENNAGSIEERKGGNADGKVIYINGENNMGTLRIEYVNS